MTRRISTRTLFAVTAAVLIPVGLKAQWPNRVDVDLLATSTDTFAASPSLASDGSGGVFLAWDDNRNSALTGRDIYIQHFDADGFAQWTPDGVAVVTALESQVAPIVVSASGGAAYAVWTDSRLPGNPRIFAQLFDPAGVRQWAVNGIRVGSNENPQGKLSAVGDVAGSLFVTWVEEGADSRAYVQKMNTEGVPLWTAQGLGYSSVADSVNLVPDGEGGVVVAWIETGGDPRRLSARRILSDGTAAFDAVSLGPDAAALHEFLSMAPDGAGGALIGWQGGVEGEEDLFLQRLDGAGNLPWGTANTTLAGGPGAQVNLRMDSDGEGGVWCAWDNEPLGASNVHIQRVTDDGSMVLAENGISVAQAGPARFNVRLAADGAGNATVAYQQNEDGIFAQKVAPSGGLLWGEAGLPVTDDGSVTDPQLVPDEAGGAILAVIAFDNGNRPALKHVFTFGRLTTSRLVNISTRAFVGTGDAQAIPGFVIGGAGAKSLLIRAVGPTLGDLGVAEVLADPVLTIFDQDNQKILERDDWGSGADAQLIADTAQVLGAFELVAGSRDAAVVESLAAQKYTTGVAGSEGVTGVALVEVYDADEAESSSFIANLSSRVFVGTGDGVAIAGFVIEGDAPLTLLIRAIGPTLESFGVSGALANPVLTLFDQEDEEMEANDDWGDGGSAARSAMADAADATGAFPLAVGDMDSAMLVTLDPGRYTAKASGAGDETGICLVELYVLP